MTYLVNLLLAPLTLLQRSTGWRRVSLLVLYVVVAVIGGPAAWRTVCLWGLPNAPEPFDLVKYGRLDVPDADNAMVAYREVIAKFGQAETKGYNPSHPSDWDVSDWSIADPEVRRWVDDHRLALEAWVRANDRSDSLVAQPEEIEVDKSLWPAAYSVHSFVPMVLLEGSRLEQTGDLAGAWRMYRSALRASRHVGRHGGATQRAIGEGKLKQSRPRIDAWINHPGMTPDLLQKAIEDVETCWAMTSPMSEMVRAEYFLARDMLNDADYWDSYLRYASSDSLEKWIYQWSATRRVRRFLRGETERSSRLLRLVTADFLARCDRPPAIRAKLPMANSWIYAHDSQTPQAVKSMTPESLESWAKDTLFQRFFSFGCVRYRDLDAEATTFEQFKLAMAKRALSLEHGRPAKTYGELLGNYLKTLPDGINMNDAIGAAAGQPLQP